MRFIYYLCFFTSVFSFGQNLGVADHYFENGEFDKALIAYKELYKTAENDQQLIFNIVKTLQQLQRYTDAHQMLTALEKLTSSPVIYIELGYNYQLQNNTAAAEKYYAQALGYLETNPRYAYQLGRSFEAHSLLSFAIETYEKAMEIEPLLDLNLQLAQVYGEQGNIEKMFTAYLAYAESEEQKIPRVKNLISPFITEEGSEANNQILFKLLLKNSQSTPNVLWNDLLSWLFVQQGDFNKAFAQEKALFKRAPERVDGLLDLAAVTQQAEIYDLSKTIYNFIIDEFQDTETQILAKQKLIEIAIETATKEDYQTILNSFETTFSTYDNALETLEIRLLHANFLAFYTEEKLKAIELLKTMLIDYKLTKFQEATVKLKLADVLVLDEKFNEALVYYTQIQNALKNSTIAQEARFKVAKTSYYKGDFDWAETQLKVLKSSTSQLIANDALELKLLISDNRFEDSLQTALKQYAKADLLDYQNKPEKAIAVLAEILNDHKTETIIDQALFKQAQLFEKTNQFEKAEVNYKQIINDYKADILIDNAYFNLAKLYEKQGLADKAKPLYEQLLFNHEDSIYYVEARNRFRKLRGDAIKL